MLTCWNLLLLRSNKKTYSHSNYFAVYLSTSISLDLFGMPHNNMYLTISPNRLPVLSLSAWNDYTKRWILTISIKQHCFSGYHVRSTNYRGSTLNISRRYYASLFFLSFLTIHLSYIHIYTSSRFYASLNLYSMFKSQLCKVT